MLDIRRIDRVPNATIHSLTETAPLIETVRLWQLRFLAHVLRLPEIKMSLSENLQCMFLLMGEGNPEDSEPCSAITFTVFWGILIAC